MIIQPQSISMNLLLMGAVTSIKLKFLTISTQKDLEGVSIKLDLC
jgi:hypothetical protein